MVKTVMSEEQRSALQQFLKKNPQAELISTYLYFIEKKFNIKPVLFVRDKIIFQSTEDIVKNLQKRENSGMKLK